MTARSFGMVLVGVLAASPALGGPAAGARAATLVDTDCAAIQVEDRSPNATSPSLPFELLDMRGAWRPFERLGRVPGAGGTGRRRGLRGLRRRRGDGGRAGVLQHRSRAW